MSFYESLRIADEVIALMYTLKEHGPIALTEEQERTFRAAHPRIYDELMKNGCIKIT